MEKILDFGKHKGKVLKDCEESYIIWISRHEEVLAERNRWASMTAKKFLEEKEKMEKQITVRGGKDHGDVRQIDGQYYIRIDTFYMNQYEMEEAYDVNIESGWYSNVKLAETEEEKKFVADYLAEKERKEQERKSKIYRANNFSLFVPQVGQRVFYQTTKKQGVITELSTNNNMVRVKKDGEKYSGWISPYHLDLVGNTNSTAFDLNEVATQ